MIEDRLRSALDEVASRVDADGRPLELPAQPAARRQRWPALVAAAVLVAFALGAVIVSGREPDRRTVVSERPRRVISLPFDSSTVSVWVSGTGRHRCAAIRFGAETEPEYQVACLDGRRLALATAVRNGMTLVYGIAAEADVVVGFVDELDTMRTESEHDEDGAAFLVIADAWAASGSITSYDRDRRIVASADFDHAGPAREPKQLLDDGETIVFAYTKHGAVWALTSTGRQVRLTDGTDNVADFLGDVAPDGRTVLHGEVQRDDIWHTQVVLDAASGRRREIPVLGGLAYSPTGDLIVGPSLTDEADGPVDAVFLDSRNFEVVRRATLTGVGGWARFSWSTDGRHVLAQGESRGELRWITVATGEVQTLAAPGADEWSVADRAENDGRFAALRRTGSTLEWGTVRVTGGQASFEAIGPLAGTENGTLPVTGRPPSLASVRGHVFVSDTGELFLDEDAPPSYLITDGRNVFEAFGNGRTLMLLLPGVEDAATP